MGIYWSGAALDGGADRGGRARERVSKRSRRVEIASLLTSVDPGTPLAQRICELSVELLGVSGAGMCLVGGARQQVIVHATDALAEELADLQIRLGQGPCIEAVRNGTIVSVPRLLSRRRLVWESYADEAVARGVRALFTFPLTASSIRLGALDLYRLEAGDLSVRQSADAFVLCDIANRFMVAQRHRPQLDGSIGGLRWLATAAGHATPGRTASLDLETTVEQVLTS